MNKKGISPIVATVLLIFIVVIIGIMVWFWVNNYIDENQEKRDFELNQECTQNTEIQINTVTCTQISDNYKIDVSVKNQGTSQIKKIFFNLISSTDSASHEIARGISAGTSGTFTFEIPIADVTSPNQLETIPVVGIGDEIKHCNEKAQYSTITC
jgi:flagellin-like protein